MNDISSLLKEIELNAYGHEGKKCFNLLYSSVREVNVEEFHVKCDGKGPTVTVLYLKNNTIYGGYTSEDWSSDKKKAKMDKNAFLFFKKDHAGAKCVFMPIAEDMADKAITCDAKFGPTFGWGSLFSNNYDLQAFKKDSKPGSTYKDGSIHLTGSIHIGCAYETEPRTIKRQQLSKFPGEVDESEIRETIEISEKTYITVDPLIVKRIDVYQVVDDEDCLLEPWRKIPSDKETEQMKKRLEDFQPLPGLGIKQYNILLIGAIGSGKSSFYNTLATVFSDSVKSHAPARGAETSVTNEIHAYELQSKSGKPLKLRIFDIRGFEENRGYDHELEHLLNGRLKDGFSFPDQSVPVKEDELIHASLKDEIHLVCFVTGISNLDTITKDQHNQISIIKKCVNRKGLPMIVVATKFDEFSEKILEDANQVYRSVEARDAIQRVSDFFGIQEKHVFPIVNYVNDDEIKDGKDRLALQALDAMIRLTTDYFEKHKEIASKVDNWSDRAKKLHIPISRPNRKIIFCKFVRECNARDEPLWNRDMSQDPSPYTSYTMRHQNEKEAILIKLGEQLTELGDNTLRVLCVGAVHSGKSSFIDSILSALRDEIFSKASGGYATGGNSNAGNVVSTTEKMHQLKYKHKSEDKVHTSKVYLGDLPGFQESGGIQLEAVKYAVRGHVPNNYKIKDGISRDSKKFKKCPEKKDKVNCICFVFDICTPAEELPSKIQETFKSLQHWLFDKDIPYIVILTKGDLLNAAAGEFKYNVFENKKLKENKDKLIEMFNFKQSKMFPVVNYVHEDTVVPENDALLIAALKEMLKLGKEYLEDYDDKDSDESDYEEQGSEEF